MRRGIVAQASGKLKARREPSGDSRPRLSSGAKLRYSSRRQAAVELCSTRTAGAAVPTRFVVFAFVPPSLWV